MGRYIMSGLCYRLELNISGIEDEEIDYVKNKVSELIDIQAYDCMVNEEKLVFTPKEHIFMDGFTDYIKEQYSLNDAFTQDGLDIIKKLVNIKTLKEAIDLAEMKMYENFQTADGYISVDGGSEYCRGYCTIIGLFMEGKVELECYDRLFNYVENLIRKDNPYQTSRFTKVVLTT